MKTPIDWPSPPSDLSMQRGAVHLWAWNFERPADDLNRYIALLSPNEHFQIQKFHFEEDRARYAVSHAALRILLGLHLGLRPESISFEQNKFGKPSLAPALAVSGLTFNLSHTKRIGLLAIAADLPIGVDIEEIRPVERKTIDRYFSARERASLATLTGNEWLEGFYNCWTRKEAILKAEGVGLNVKLGAFDVSLIPNAKAEVLGVRPNAGFTSSWHLVELRPSSGTVGALATDAPPASIQCYRF